MEQKKALKKIGIKEGEKIKQSHMEKSMKTKNLDINIISEITGLTIEEIKKKLANFRQAS